MSEASIESEVDRLYERVVARGGRPILLEALWDGDTQGWMLCLFVTLRRRPFRRTRESLGCLRYGGDVRLFSGAVPPWPESEVPTDSPYLPKDVCYHCHLRRERDAKLRREPSANIGSRGYCVAIEGQSASYRAVESGEQPMLKLIGEADPGHPPMSDHRLEPEAVAILAELAVAEVERLLETHDPRPRFEQIPLIQVEWRGRELELEPHMTENHRALYEAIALAEFAEHAQASGLAVEVFTNAGIKRRDGHVLGQLIMRAGQATRAELRQRHAKEFGSERAVDEAVARLLEAGCVHASEDTIRVTRKGELLGNSPEEG